MIRSILSSQSSVGDPYLLVDSSTRVQMDISRFACRFQILTVQDLSWREIRYETGNLIFEVRGVGARETSVTYTNARTQVRYPDFYVPTDNEAILRIQPFGGVIKFDKPECETI